MFSLVKFVGDNVLSIVESSHVKKKQETTLVKWKRTFYEAVIISVSDSRTTLQEILKEKNKKQSTELLEPPIRITSNETLEKDKEWHSRRTNNSTLVATTSLEGQETEQKNLLEDSLEPFSDSGSEYKPESDSDDSDGQITIFGDQALNYSESSSSIQNYTPSTDLPNWQKSQPKYQLLENNKEVGGENTDKLTLDPCSLLEPHLVKKKEKKNSCYFCQALVTHLPRHLERIHGFEERVKEFALLPRGCPERKALIEKLRKDGNFQEGREDKIVPVRRSAVSSKGKFHPCPRCRGFYSKISLRKHYVRCCKNTIKGEKNLFQLSRKIQGKCHTAANSIVKNEIFPVLREDMISSIVKYDELACIYANKMSLKYRQKYHHKMIRARLRLIGRILYQMKKLDSTVTDFSSIFVPQHFDNVITCINEVAGMENNQQKYKSPSTAFAAGTLLKKCAMILITELIKKENLTRKEQVENFLKLISEDIGITVNKTVEENQLQKKLLKKVVLPSSEDIKLLNEYLKSHRRRYYDLLKENFSYTYYKKLASLTLTSLQVFNRRRAGEVERIAISDYKNKENICSGHFADIYQKLSPEGQLKASTYVRLTIRGKLGREVTVILYKELVQCIDLILKNRDRIGISKENPYVFGLPSKFNPEACLGACSLLREYSVECGAKNPKSLRGTELRKHIATSSVLYNLNDTEVRDLASFMGHSKEIHHEHYRLPIAAREITEISKLLELAQGEEPEDIADVSFNSIASEEGENLSLHKRNSSPYGKCKRISWTDIEKLRVKEYFGDLMSQGNSPSLNECENVIAKCEELKYRSSAQLKSFIHNQIAKAKKPINQTPRRSIVPWDEGEKSLLKTTFKENLKALKYPSATQCQDVLNKNPDILGRRTGITIKAWIVAEINRSKKKQ